MFRIVYRFVPKWCYAFLGRSNCTGKTGDFVFFSFGALFLNFFTKTTTELARKCGDRLSYVFVRALTDNE